MSVAVAAGCIVSYLAVVLTLCSGSLRRSLLRCLGKRIARNYTRRDLTGIVGWRELELDPNFLIERSDVGETKAFLNKIGPVESNEDYTFVYLTAVSACIIPRERVVAGDYGRFIDDLNLAIERTRGPRAHAPEVNPQ